jgi:hypothetical protein
MIKSNRGMTRSCGLTAVLALSQSKTLMASKEHFSARPFAAAFRFEDSIASALWSRKWTCAAPARAACNPNPPRKLKQSRTCAPLANCETA